MKTSPVMPVPTGTIIRVPRWSTGARKMSRSSQMPASHFQFSLEGMRQGVGADEDDEPGDEAFRLIIENG